MAVDKEAVGLSRVHIFYCKCHLVAINPYNFDCFQHLSKSILAYGFSIVHGCLAMIVYRSAVIRTDVGFPVGRVRNRWLLRHVRLRKCILCLWCTSMFY